MKDEHKTRQQLINELVELRGCIAELETVEAQYKKIKEALQESEKEYRQFTDFLPQIVFEVDKRGNITFANRKLLEFFGYNQDDLEKGLNIFQMVISEDRDRARDNMQKRLSGEELGGNEYTALRKDGSTFPFVIYATPIIHGNKLVGLRGIAVDITQRKQTEEALRESEKRLRDIFEAASNVSFIMTDLAGIEAHILEFSPGAERIFGYSREEVIGKPVAMLHLLEDVVRFPEVIEAMRQRKEGFTGESTLVRKSGEKFPALFTTYPVFDAKGNMTATLGVSIDITERKRAEEALRQSEEKYRTTFEHTGTAMAIDNEDKTICLVNTEAEKLTGYKKEELEGKMSGISFVHPEDLERVKSYHYARREGKPVPKRYEFRLIDREGNIKNILASVGMIPGTKNAVVSLIDITQRKRAEEALQASLKEKEILLQEIHHRVKNNMQLVYSLIKLQSGYMRDKMGIEMLKEIQNRVRSMSLIHEKLYQSKDLASVDFNEYVSDLVNVLYRAYGVDRSKIKSEVIVKDVSLRIDFAIPCGLIINELVSNSLKYAFPESREGEIKVALHPIDKNQIELIVSDNGIGIPKDLDFRKTKSLGLHLVTILAENQLHGRIKLDRTKGTKFKIKFKAAK